MKIGVRENKISLFDSWFVDLRDFAFFIQKYIDSAPKMNILVYDLEFMGTSNFSPKY